MRIGIDGNEANVKQRVGSGQYAFELLKQFAKISNYSSSESNANRTSREVTAKNIIVSKESSRQAPPEAGQARTIKFLVYLKETPLPDLPKESENFKYKVFGPKKLWTQFALPIRLTFGLPREAKALWGKKPDVFFSMAHYGPRFSKVPYVVTIHDLSYLHFPEMFKKNDLYQLTSWSKYSIKNAAHIIAVSQTTKEDIVKNYNIDPSKITVTYEGYDKDRFNPQSKSKGESVKRKYKIVGNYIIFVGTLQPRKNLERLLDAFKILVQSSQSTVNRKGETVNREPTTKNFQLVIVGKKGWLYEPIFQRVKDLNLDDLVIFTDFVPDEDLPALIGGAEAYILPSLWEGFGIPVIEAQACGVPVVVSNTSSLPEIVGESGVLVDPEDINSIAAGIKKALNPKTKSDLVKKGLTNIKRFSWVKCARVTLEVLEKAVARWA